MGSCCGNTGTGGGESTNNVMVKFNDFPNRTNLSQFKVHNLRFLSVIEVIVVVVVGLVNVF